MTDEQLIDADRSSQLAVSIRPSKASRALLVVGLVVVLAGVGGGVAWHFGRPESAGPLVARRVAFELRGWPEGAQGLRDALHEAIEEAGLEAVPAEGEGPPLLADLARAHEATQAARLTLEVVEERAGLAGTNRFVVGRVTAHTVDLTEGAALREPSETTLAAEAPDRDEALRDIGQRAVEMLAPQVVAELVTSPAIAALVEGRAAANVSRINSVRRAFGGAVSRDEAVTSFSQACQAAEGELAAGVGAVTPRPLTAACGRARPVGMTSDGQAAMVLVDGPVPWFPLETPARPRAAEALARIDLVPVGAGSGRRTLARGVGFSEVESSLDGSTVIAVEVAGGLTGLVAIDIATGERRLLQSVQGPERLSEPRPSPDGRLVAYVHASGARDSGRRLVVPVAGGSEVELSPAARSARWVRVGDDGRLLIAAIVRQRVEAAREAYRAVVRRAGLTPSGEAPLLRHVVLIDPATGEVVARHWSADRQVNDVLGDVDGTVLVVSRRGLESGCALGRLDSGAPEIAWLPLAPCPSDVVASPRGWVVGVAVASTVDDEDGRDFELIQIDPTTGLVTPLTANTVGESAPRVAAGASSVVFARALPAPWREFPRIATMAGTL